MLHDVIEPPRALHAALVSRLKVMASLDIAEKRMPQDGRMALKLGDKSVDVRVSTLPTGPGERVVLRLLDKDTARLDLTALGMSDATLAAVDRLIREPHGIVLVTGPTGSGKTTTLYAAMSRLDRGTLNVMTVEDPIEFALDGVGQTQVNPKIELNFARALRAILRQDPDIIMIGEIRDLETAQIAVQASLTGHMVLATLHTNDAASAVTRLADMGVEPYLLASSLLGVLAQRLVRRLCPACRAAAAPTPGEASVVERLGLSPARPICGAVGCAACGDSGYRGRTGIYELLLVDDALRRLIHDRAGEAVLRDQSMRAGTRPLIADGARWLADGTTSLAELLRVAGDAG
jgi:general secretion pathway protein E